MVGLVDIPGVPGAIGLVGLVDMMGAISLIGLVDMTLMAQELPACRHRMRVRLAMDVLLW